MSPRAGRPRERRPTVGGPAAAVTALALVAVVAPRPADAQLRGEDLPVREVELDNGMRILVLPRPGAPTVSLVVQYEVGGVDEHVGTTGTAHLLEHMLFKGTTTVGTTDVEAERELFGLMDAAHDTVLALRARPRPDTARIAALEDRIRALEDSARTFVVANEFDRILSRAGARGLNASTTNDATTYYVELPANRLELWFVLEADRYASPVFREFYTERDVVMEERRSRVDTSPAGLLYEAHLGAAYTVHPYRLPVVGHMSDLRTASRREVREWYRRYYGPGNAVVAIVGDVDPDRVEVLARRYLAPLPPGEEPPHVFSGEPVQRGERRVEVAFPAEPRLRLGWHVVDVFHEDMPALVMLTSVLTGGPRSRLYRRLVLEDGTAAQVTSVLGPGSRFPQLFQVDVLPRAPHGADTVMAALEEELDRLRREPPDEDELQRVRSHVDAGRVRRLQSHLGLAFQLAGSAALHGDWRTTFRLSERIADVTPADVQRVVRRYFRPSNRTVAVLVRSEAEGGGDP